MAIVKTVLVHRCPHCGGEQIVRNGHTGYGAQRARCRPCRRTFVLERRQAPYTEADKARVLHAYTQERLSMRSITRTFGVAYETLRAWTEKK